MAFFKMGAFADYLSGKSGNTVFLKTKGGTVVRDLIIPTNPQTGSQQFVRNNLGDASRAFADLTGAQVDAWDEFGSGQRKRTRGGKKRSRMGYSAFMGLSTKLLQANPGATIPVLPPTTAFSGDPITLTATAGTGMITFESSGDNSANVKTEILLQKLTGENRKAQKGAYRSHGFFSMNSEAPTVINVPAGYFAAAYRFVSTVTGQMTGMVHLPVQTVALSMVEGKPAGKSVKVGKKAA